MGSRARRFGLSAALLFAVAPARADELIGVESEEEAAEPTRSPEAEPAPEAKPEKPATSRPGEFSFAGGFSASKNTLGGQATVGYSINRYVGVEGTYSYFQLDSSRADGVAYGPDLAGVLRLPNPTIATPFVGAGPGFVKWQRSYDDEVFDAGSAMTFAVFGGVNLGLTRHFGLQIARRQTVYLQDPPVRFDDRTTRESRERLTTHVGFYMAF